MAFKHAFPARFVQAGAISFFVILIEVEGQKKACPIVQAGMLPSLLKQNKS
jgi:hypothetical protein